MKQETLHTLIIAKTLLERAQELCIVEDKFITSAGLVVLQDSLELVLYASLIELGVDEEKDIENFNFYELLKELKTRGKKIIKSGTLKALNRERVNVKHYGQVAEPATVRNFLKTAKESIDTLLLDVLGKDFQSIFLHELIRKGEVKDHLENTSKLIEEKKYFEALVEIRKAIFIEIEEEYSIEGWKDAPTSEDIFSKLMRGGAKAPWYTKSKKWIEENVKDPFDYIQLDHGKLRVDLMEWGVSTQDFWNLWRLTPQVFRIKESGKWLEKIAPEHIIEAATEGNVKYCLERTISLIIKKQGHFDLGRYLSSAPILDIKVKLKEDKPIFDKASRNARIVAELSKDEVLTLESVLQGLDSDEKFGKVFKVQKDPSLFLVGYISYDYLEIINES